MAKRIHSLKVGDKVVHRYHGGGIICDLTERDMNGQTVKYFVIDNIIDGMKHYIPVLHAAEAELNPVEAGETPEVCLQRILKKHPDIPSDQNRLTEIVNEKIQDGSVEALATAVGMVYEYKKRDSINHRPLSQLTRKVLQHAEKLLTSHIALVRNTNYPNAQVLLQNWVEQVYPQVA